MPPSMTLSVSPGDASLLSSASQSLLASLRALHPTRSTLKKSWSTGGMPQPFGDASAPPPDLYGAARTCDHPLVAKFLRQNGNRSREDLNLLLLLFLDLDKSTKLLTAFALLSGAYDGNNSGTNGNGNSGNKDDVRDNNGVSRPNPTDVDSLRIPYARVLTLFDCFLTSIATCIHTSPASPAGTLGPDTAREIRQIAVYAADHMMDHYRRKRGSSNSGGSGGGSEENDPAVENVRFTFSTFGEWYNSGGFELVPWLELLDLNKWETSGNSGAAVNDRGNGKVSSSSNKTNNTFSGGNSSTMSKDEKAKNNIMEGIVDGGTKDTYSGPSSGKKSGKSGKNHRRARSSTSAAAASPQPAGAQCPPEGSGGGSGAVVPMPPPPNERYVVSFDFTGAMPSDQPLHINITEENLRTLRSLVMRTNLVRRSPEEVGRLFLTRTGPMGELHKTSFDQCMREIVPVEELDQKERITFSQFLTDLFSCFDRENVHSVNGKELTAGFSFLCSGNKSSKLVIAFELFDENQTGKLSSRSLTCFLRSYLSMLVGISLSSTKLSRAELFDAVDNGANWTTSHVFGSPKMQGKSACSFDDFAEWYTEGGYSVAPWLELIDLKKLLSLMEGGEGDTGIDSLGGGSGGPDDTFDDPTGQKGNVLFSFPLAHDHSLIVLEDDVKYVQNVLDQLNLLSMPPEHVWSRLSRYVKWTHKVNKTTFVQAMEAVISNSGKVVDSEMSFTLANFFSSFDLKQSDIVPLNQLMGGLALLCQGRKSAKLSFAFGLFDRNGKGHLTVDEIFLFLRSFLIVLFSCCAQSLELSADDLTDWINDTSRMISENITERQWNLGKTDVTFDDFGEWYNDGGFDTAPWLELLDLNKWVLEHQVSGEDNGNDSKMMGISPDEQSRKQTHNNILPSSVGSGGGGSTGTGPSNNTASDESVEFNLYTNDENGGYIISVPQECVLKLRQVVQDGGLYSFDAIDVGNLMIERSKDKHLTKDGFNAMIRSMVPEASLAHESRHRIADLLGSIFFVFDRERNARVNVYEFAAGFTILFRGSKSDKLEYAFGLIDEDKDGKLSRRGLWRFLRSFLVVLLCMSSAKTDMAEDAFFGAIDAGATWASTQIFNTDTMQGKHYITFDDFADWYTQGGYGNVPWLELLDLKKWALS